MTNIIYIGNMLAARGRTPTHIDTLTPLLEKEGFNVRAASSKLNKAIRLVDMLNTVRANKDWADVVLIDTYSTLNFWFAIAVSRLCSRYNLPYVPILHGGNLPQRLKTTGSIFHRYLREAYKIVCPSQYLASQFKSDIYPNLTVIYNTIELEEYSFKKRTHIAPKLLWVRSFADIYNPTMAVQVASKLSGNYDGVELCMVGPDKDGTMATTKTLAQKMGVNLKLTGTLSRTEWHKLSTEYDVLINTTHFDNLPVSLLEAMALGLPIVSTNVGGIPYLINDKQSGLLVNDSSVEQMTNAIHSLIEDKDLVYNITKNGRLTVQDYSWSTVKEQWINLLNEVQSSPVK
ncbi:MAG: glycosyltransferase family 4 protein [Nonlabens sp.]